MSRRLLVIFITCCVLAAALFARFGLWQVSRLREKQAFNALVRAGLDSPVVDFARLPHDAASARFRRVRASGRWDAAHELVLASRSRAGSPGVHLLTPLRVAGSDTALLVNRGWVYAPDGAAVPEPARWRVRDDTGAVTVEGFVVLLPPPLPKMRGAGKPPRVWWIDHADVARWAGYPVHGFQLVQVDDSLPRDSTPARIAPPPPDDGPHRGYAFQWFSFALIALVGMPVFLLTRGREAARAARVPPAPPLPR
jgi:surfeit locus 1 family protein